jgi:hypothetical protein
MIEFAERDVVRERARALGAAMTDENGVATAVEEIEALVTGGVEAEPAIATPGPRNAIDRPATRPAVKIQGIENSR